MTATADVVDVILRDGRTLRLRPPRREDADALLAFFSGLSERSLYLRFHGLPALRPQLVEPVLEPDWTERGALLGTVAADDGEEQVVALANYVRLRDPSLAESAFTVSDAWQGRGIGTRLLEQLAARASGVGIERFVAEVMPDNRAMLGVFEHVGFRLTRVLESGTIEVQFPIARTEAYELHVAERDHEAVVASLRPFFEAGTVAVVGASRKRGSIGGELFRNILAADFVGAAHPVNLKGEPVAGVQAYTSITDIPGDVDLAVISLPGEAVIAAADEALRKGVKALVVISAGFAEIGSEGAARQDRLLELVRAHGARMIGPNCLGIAVYGRGLDATFAARAAPPGNIGFSSQSGALGLAMLEAAEARGLGLSSFVSIGNKADVSSNDLIEYWEDDPETSVVMLYVESFGNPRRFGRIARRVARRKPILALKSGTTSAGQRAASSHTAALAGSEAAVDALFHQAGVIRATSLEELIDVAALLSTQPEPRGRSVALITNAGGLGILGADACEAAGLELASLSPETIARVQPLLPVEASLANPVDMLGSATDRTYAEVLPAILDDPAVDAAIVMFVPAVTATAEAVAEAIEAAARATTADKPILAVVMSAAGIPTALVGGRAAAFAYPESAARALGRAAARAEWLRRPQGTVPELERIDRAAAEAVVEEALAEADDVWLTPGADAPAARGLRPPARPGAHRRDASTRRWRRRSALGYPVVVKTAAPGVHKTEIGGLALDLGDAAAVREAAERIGPPLVVQPMIAKGTELLAGLVQDPVFGPLVAFGPGGVFAELIGRATFRIAPLTDVDAAELVTGGAAGRLVAGFRGAPPADVDALTDLVHRLGRLGEELPQVAELDLNPVLATADGVVAVDARVRASRAERMRRTKSW